MARLNKTKAKQAILYVSYKMARDPSFGSTVLNKVLYYLDHTHYLRYGSTITGFQYVKQVHGPTPDPEQFWLIKRELIESRELGEKEAPYFGKLQKRPFAIQQPNVTCFTPQEVAIIDEIIEQFNGVTGTGASDYSHEELAWQLADQMEVLPPYTFLLSEAALNKEDIAWAKEIIEGHRGSSASQTLTPA